MKREINRLKVVLAEKKRTNRWVAAQLGNLSSTYKCNFLGADNKQ